MIPVDLLFLLGGFGIVAAVASGCTYSLLKRPKREAVAPTPQEEADNDAFFARYFALREGRPKPVARTVSVTPAPKKIARQQAAEPEPESDIAPVLYAESALKLLDEVESGVLWGSTPLVRKKMAKKIVPLRHAVDKGIPPVPPREMERLSW